MKKTKDKKSKPAPAKGKKSRMDALRDQWENDDVKEKDERLDTMEEGKNVRRVLPNKTDGEPFFLDYSMHWNVGPEGNASHRCIEPGGAFGISKKEDKRRNYSAKKCPSCKRYSKARKAAQKFEFGSKAGKKFWMDEVKPLAGRHSFVMAVTLPRSDSPDDIKVLKCGVKIARPLIAAYFDEDGGGDFTDPVSGRNVIIRKTLLGKGPTDVDYEVTVSPNQGKLANWKTIRKALPDLEEFLPEELTPEAIEELLEGSGDEDAAPRKKRRSKDDDDDDEDTDDEEEDEEDDEDEDESPKRGRKSRTRDDDEDVDPEEDEESDDDEDSEDEDEEEDSDDDEDEEGDDDDDDEDSDDDDDEDSESDDDDEEDEDEDDKPAPKRKAVKKEKAKPKKRRK